VLVRDITPPRIVGSYYSAAHGRVVVVVAVVVIVAVEFAVAVVIVIIIVIVCSIQLVAAAVERLMKQRRLIRIRRDARYWDNIMNGEKRLW
jgi:hypothetical protein